MRCTMPLKLSGPWEGQVEPLYVNQDLFAGQTGVHFMSEITTFILNAMSHCIYLMCILKQMDFF